MSSNHLIKRLLSHLNVRRRVQLSLVLVLMILSVAAEAVSLATVMPFLWGLTNPQELWQWPLVQRVAPLLGVSQAADLLLPAALLFSVAVLVAAVIRLTSIWLSTRLSAAIGSDWSLDAFHRSVCQPYAVYLGRNSSVLITSMTSQLEQAVHALNQSLQMFSAFTVLVGLLIGLFLVDWQAALIAWAVASLIYGVVVGVVKASLLHNGEVIARSQMEQIKVLRESFGGIRDLILNGTQRFFFESYRRIDRPMRQCQAQNQFLSVYPRYAVEAIGMVAIAVLAYGFVSRRGGANEVVPLLGILALAAQRLLPTIQLIYSAWTDIRSKSPAVRAVLDVLSQPLPPSTSGEILPLAIMSHISFERVSFRYHTDAPPVIQEASFRINKGERIGIAGSTGSGKSTTLDLLMGLLAPSSGRICIDDIDLHEPLHPARLLAWRAAIAHVPQNIYLADSSFAANIAFGVLPEQIDMDRVRQAARQAQIAGFIESSPHGYAGAVGERGVRLSGGQRQRIGIARALYRRAQVLIFDEATNALDSATEQAVVEAIESLGHDLTIIVVAHRLTTLRSCTQVVELVHGRIARIGSYQSLVAGRL